jgi:Na+/H+ antiporter NhaC
MKNSIEVIWKEGFLNEKSLVAPKINDLYNQKSRDLVDKIERMYKINIIAIIIMAIVFPIIDYFMDVVWQGVATSILFLLGVWYNTRKRRSFKTLDHGATSLDFLKSFDRRIKDDLSRSEKVLRFIYPLSFLIAMSIIWSAWDKGPLTSKMYQEYPDVIFIGSVPLFAWIIAGVATLLMFYFSGRIYRWDVGLIYGRIFQKLEKTIAEMETLKQG